MCAYEETVTSAEDVVDALDEGGASLSELEDPERAEEKDVALRRLGLTWGSSEWPDDDGGCDLDPVGVEGRLGRRNGGDGR